jgi:hypothetical protein
LLQLLLLSADSCHAKHLRVPLPLLLLLLLLAPALLQLPAQHQAHQPLLLLGQPVLPHVPLLLLLQVRLQAVRAVALALHLSAAGSPSA